MNDLGPFASLTGRADGPPLLPAAGLLEYAASQAARINAVAPDAAVDGPAELVVRAALRGWSRLGPRTIGGAGRAVRTVDGWVAVSLARDQDRASIPAVVGEDVEPGWASLEAWADNHPAEDVAARLQLLEVPAAVIPLEQRPVTPAVQSMPLRRPGFGGGRVRRSWLTSPRSGRARCALGFSVWPAAGWSRWSRQAVPTALAAVSRLSSTDCTPGTNRFAVDFATASGRRSLVALLQAADVVIEASRRRALRAMSILPDQIAGPGALWLSITAYGRDPATEQLVGFGDDVAGGAGGWVLDPSTGVPMPSLDAVADPLTGLAAAAAVLEVLHGEDSMVLDVAMHRVVTEAVAGRPTMPGTVWFGACPTLAKPDVPGRRAPAMGAQTAAVLAEVGARP